MDVSSVGGRQTPTALLVGRLPGGSVPGFIRREACSSAP